MHAMDTCRPRAITETHLVFFVQIIDSLKIKDERASTQCELFSVNRASMPLKFSGFGKKLDNGPPQPTVLG